MDWSTDKRHIVSSSQVVQGKLKNFAKMLYMDYVIIFLFMHDIDLYAIKM